MTYPFLFNLDRGNLEAWLFMALVVFIYYYRREKYFVSMIFLSFAIAFKLYPALLMLLFIFDKKYKYAIYTCILTFLLSVISAFLFQGGLMASLKGLGASLSSFNSGALRYQGLQHNTSIFAPLKLVYDYILLSKDAFTVSNQKTFYNAYFLFALLLFALLLFFLFKYKLAFWKKVALLVLSFITLPQVSYDYKLINLFIPVVLFIGSEEKSKFTVYYAIIFGLLLIPKDYYFIVADVSISSIINPLLNSLLIMMILFEAARSGEKISAIRNPREKASMIYKNELE